MRQLLLALAMLVVLGVATPAQAAITFFGSTVTGGSTAEPTAITLTPPASMLAGDLVVWIEHDHTSTVTVTNQVTGGQSWNTVTAITGTNFRSSIFWCVFNGTWAASPSFQPSGGTADDAAGLFVFRPTTATDTWVLDTAPTAQTIASSASPSMTGITTTNANTVVIAQFGFAGTLPTWTAPTGWTNLGVGYIYSAFNLWVDSGLEYRVYTSPSSTGTVTDTPDGTTTPAGTGAVFAFAETTGSGSGTSCSAGASGLTLMGVSNCKGN